MRFCKDCRYFDTGGPVVRLTPICLAVMDPVMGEPAGQTCSDARGEKGQCGPDAKLFKERGEAEGDPRKEGQPVKLNLTGGRRMDRKIGRSDG